MSRLLSLLALTGLGPTPAGIETLPQRPTPASALSTKVLRHHEVLRIDRDFGMDHWEIALDGWLPHADDGRIHDVRLWWVNTDDGDRRKPFSATLQRVIEFGYQRTETGALAVRMAGDHKAYHFTVELDADGDPAVFADVALPDGSTVVHCRCERGRLIARRILGIAVGIGALNVRCIDGEARPHDGAVPYAAEPSG